MGSVSSVWGPLQIQILAEKNASTLREIAPLLQSVLQNRRLLSDPERLRIHVRSFGGDRLIQLVKSLRVEESSANGDERVSSTAEPEFRRDMQDLFTALASLGGEFSALGTIRLVENDRPMLDQRVKEENDYLQKLAWSKERERAIEAHDVSWIATADEHIKE